MKTQSRKRIPKHKHKRVIEKKRITRNKRLYKTTAFIIYSLYLAAGCAYLAHNDGIKDNAQVYIQAQLDYTELCVGNFNCGEKTKATKKPRKDAPEFMPVPRVMPDKIIAMRENHEFQKQLEEALK